MSWARFCLLAVTVAACGDGAMAADVSEDSGPPVTVQTDASPVEAKPSEGSRGAGGSAPLIATEGGPSDAAVARTDGQDGASTTRGPEHWVGTPFVMDTWFWSSSGPVADRVAQVQQLGYQGLALSADHQVAEYVAAMQARGLKMPGIWVAIDVASYPTDLVKAIAATGGWIWLSLSSKTATSSDVAADDQALSLLGRLADECHAAGLPGVALYPHVGMWMERVGDAVRLAKKAQRSEVGVVFNQYHWMAVEGGRDLDATLAGALPYLKDVTINGSDAAPTILPLGQGAYDVASILRALSKLDYRGSVGLQGYSIAGDIPGKLQSSKKAWDDMMHALTNDGG